MNPGKRPSGNAFASSSASGTLIRLRGIPNIAARPDLMSTLSTTIVSVRRSQRPVPASLPTSSRLSRPSWAQSGTGLGEGDGVGVTSGPALGGTMTTAGGPPAVVVGAGDASSSGAKLAGGICQSPLGSSSPWNTAARVSSVSIPSAATEPCPSVATPRTATRPATATRPVRRPAARLEVRATSHASTIANR